MDIASTVNNELEKLDIIYIANKKKHRPTVNITLSGRNIEQVSHTTFLGVIIDENLTWIEQIKNG